MSAASRKKKTVRAIVLIVTLLLGLVYFLRPFWWESYHYEDNQIKVQLFDVQGSSERGSLAGTVVLRLTGRGMARCGWGQSGSKSETGEANGALLTIAAISSQVTDDAGLVDAPSYAGFGWGTRGFMGGCQHNLGFLVLMTRSGYATHRVTPRFDKLNTSYHVIRPPRSRRATMTRIDYARNRLWNELQVLYPTRVPLPGLLPNGEAERQALMSMVAYWRHKLPNGQAVRSYAIEHLLRVNAGLNCPRLETEILRTFDNDARAPETEAEVLAEHAALSRVLSASGASAIVACDLRS